MGCKSSKTQKQIIRDNGDLFNKDGDVRKKLLTGFQMSKDADGIEANFQIAFWKRTQKKYEKWRAHHHLSKKTRNLKRKKTHHKGIILGSRIFRKMFVFRKNILFSISFVPRQAPS